MKEGKVIILGGGITGLAAAWRLEKMGIDDITIIEATGRAGGKVTTIYENGYIAEAGPDSFITVKPQALQLVNELGMNDELIEPKTHKFYVLRDGCLVTPPAGLRLMVPMDLKAFLDSKFFTWPARHRILMEGTIPARHDDKDESFADFISRRFGREMLDYYAEPLFAGIYATPAAELSMNATMPMFSAMEKKHGSLTHAVKKMDQSAKPEMGRSQFLGLKKGIQSLTDKLAASLEHTTFLLNEKIVSVTANDENVYSITVESGKVLTTDKLICTLPAHITAELFGRISPELKEVIDSFTYSSSHVVNLAYDAGQIDQRLDGTGFVIPVKEQKFITACTWASSKWENRAPEGKVLIRCYARSAPGLTDKQFAEKVHEELIAILGIDGEPERYWVNHWENSLPQYKVGHMEKISRLRKAVDALPGLAIAGPYLEGVGMPDCIRQAETAVQKCLQTTEL